ncbi:MAG: class I SAM-dependent rRNA methyltransferase [Planctomycetes bacterium]|nr:class I SAM-dependent rRNA methyltransferase [Planctomycetota bacterium]
MPPSALTVPPAQIAKVMQGCPVIKLADLGSSSLLSNPGRALKLVNSRGEFLACGVVDPENEAFHVFSWDPDEAPDDRLLIQRARAAFRLRERLGLIPPDRRLEAAFRLLNGEGDGLPGFLVEVLGPYAVQYVLAKGLREWGRRLIAAVVESARELGLQTPGGEPWPRGVLQKLRGKDSARPGKPVQWVEHGEEPPEKLLVKEGDFSFEVHPLAGLNVGLFGDMREHRARIGRFARGVKVLNTFAYTGTLSVAAAAAGSLEVTSVDLSSGVLKWAEENFRLAGLDPDRHRFEASDVLRFLRQAAMEGRQYGLVILDPPTYSAARAASWSLKNHLGELIESSLALLPPGGILWLSVNSHQMGGPELEAQLRESAAASRRGLALLEEGGPAPDFPTAITFPEGRHLKLRILRVW